MEIPIEETLKTAKIELEIYRVKVLNNLNSWSNFRNIERFHEQEIIIKTIEETIEKTNNTLNTI